MVFVFTLANIHKNKGLCGSMCAPVDSHLWTLTHLASKTLYVGSHCRSCCQRPFWSLWLEARFWSSSSRLMHLHWLVHFHSPLPRPEGSIHPPSAYRIIFVSYNLSAVVFFHCYLKDEDVGIGGVLPQSVFPRDRELCFLRVCPLHTRILVAVDLHPQPGDEEWFGVRHSCRHKKKSAPSVVFFIGCLFLDKQKHDCWITDMD